MDVSPRFEIGQTILKDLWVDPVSGQDDRSGDSKAQALRTVDAAWQKIPERTAGHGWRVLLCPGKYAPNQSGQVVLEHRQGSAACPIMLQATEGPLSLDLPALNFRFCRFVYLLDLHIRASANAQVPGNQDIVLHFADSQDLLIRGVTATGYSEAGGKLPQLVFKANQCLRVYIEDCDFSGAEGNTIDYVAVQYGHIVRNRLHDVQAECMYVKGGSAYHLIAGNEMFNSVNHGLLAGQGTGFAYMVSPWLHYEAYDIKAVNNVIHDCGGGVATTGGYNILLAWNTCYRVGTSRDVIVVGLGGRGWTAHDVPGCERRLAEGGWCDPSSEIGHSIPCRNVVIANNVILNPEGFESRFAHFGISGPVATPARSNLPSPARADENLVIHGNVIWNGPLEKPLLDDCENVYHLAARPTFNAEELRRHNVINMLRPDLLDPERGDFRPKPGGNLYKVKTTAIRDFDWSDAPSRPPVPPGSPDNQALLDRAGKPRTAHSPPGAFV